MTPLGTPIIAGSWTTPPRKPTAGWDAMTPPRILVVLWMFLLKPPVPPLKGLARLPLSLPLAARAEVRC